MVEKSLDSRLAAVSKFWNTYEADVIAKEIFYRSDLPDWEDCGKREIYVGVLRSDYGDKLFVIKHLFEAEYNLSVPVEDLDFVKEWFYFTGPYGEQICDNCGEFSTSINVYQKCHDCK